LPHHSGKLIWRGFDGTRLPGWLGSLLEQDRCGGIVLFGRNVEDPRQVHEIAREACARHSGPGVLPVAVDQEGGRVARLREPHFTAFPPARTVARATPGSIEAAGRAMGEEMAACGVNMDFAPVLDVQDGLDGVIGDRAFSGDPARAARAALAWLRGLESAGVAGCVKHFPGHGDASCDSHVDLPRADGDMDGLASRHLPPFREACAAGVRAVMVAHILVPGADPRRPASLSPAIVDGLLRQELGFDGLVVTDDLEMGAVTRHNEVGEAAVLAVEAGCDALLVCATRRMQDEAVSALEAEAAASQAFRRLLERSVSRLERFTSTLVPPPATLRDDLLRSQAHLMAAGEIGA